MASTFSDLKIELIATGEQSGTWGTTTNTNLGTALEQAITGSGDVSFSSADVTLTLTDTNASQTARNLRLNLTGTSGGARNLIVPAIEKQYIVNNGLADTVTVKNSTGTGVAVPAGKTMVVFNNATDVVDVTNHASSLTLGSALPVASGGTGQTSYTDGQLLIGNTTGNTLAKSTLTAGSGVSITNGSGSITISATGLGGDVVGPASSTDNAVVRFDGTTGKLVQNSNVIIADDGTTVISTNSATDALRITQTGAGNALVVEDSTNPDSTPFVVDASGNVGIGVTPTTKFSGYDSGAFTMQLESDAGVTIQSTRYTTDTSGSNLALRKARGTKASPTIVNDGDVIGVVNFNAYDGAAYVGAAQIQARVDGTPGSSDMPGRLVFLTTADGASTTTERMRINSAGNVGIGGVGGAEYKFLITGTLPTNLNNSLVASVEGTIPSGTTSAAQIFRSSPSTQAASFVLGNLYHFYANQNTIGAGSSINSQYGFVAESSLTGATNNYGFYSNIAFGTGRWNFYANGTAENYLAGNLKIGATTARGTTAGTNHVSLFNGTAPAGTLTDGVTLYSASGDFNFMDSAGNGFKVGYRNIPAVGTKTSSYILAVGDVGKYVQVSTGGSITIPDATFSEGDAISIFNNTSAGITITCSITTAYIAGTDSDKATMTLATRGMATILFISGTVCVVSGNVT
jgi:hypothetical protein